MLLIGGNEFISTNKEWNVVAAPGTEEAIQRFQQRNFDVVVFTNTAEADEIKLRKLFSFQQPGIIMLQNQNDDLIVTQINEELEKKQDQNKPSFSFVDDALKHAMLPITIQ